MDITDPLKKIMARCLDFLKKNTTGRFLGTKVSHFLDRSYIAYIHDVVMATVSIVLSLLLRVGDSILYYEPFIIFKHMIIYGLISAGIFLWTGIYRGVWRYTSLSDLMAIGLSVTCASVVYAPLMLFMGQTAALPRSLVAINWFVLCLAALGGALLGEIFLGLKPCILCVYQRYVYMGIAVMALGGLIVKSPKSILLCSLGFIVGAGVAFYQVAVETHLVDLPSVCQASLHSPRLQTMQMLKDHLLQTPVIPCDRVQWSLAGISMAGYNGIFSLLFSFMSLYGYQHRSL